MVVADGVAITLVLESERRARSIAAKFTPDEAMRPMPKVGPRGAVVAVDGLLTARARSMIDSGLLLAAPTGETKPPAGMVGLPSLDQTAQFTPRSEALSMRTSTMMASTSTCARRISKRSTMVISMRMVLGGAVTTMALVCGSAQMLVALSAVGAAPAAPAVLAVTPVNCSLSLGAIFSALA